LPMSRFQFAWRSDILWVLQGSPEAGLSF
jgi:hypothetical protein